MTTLAEFKELLDPEIKTNISKAHKMKQALAAFEAWKNEIEGEK